MKVKTDELVAEKEAKEVSEAIKDLDILTEKSKEENQDIRTLMFENLKELVFQSVFDDIDASLEKFRCKIYGTEYTEPQREPVSGKMLYFNEDGK